MIDGSYSQAFVFNYVLLTSFAILVVLIPNEFINAITLVYLKINLFFLNYKMKWMAWCQYRQLVRLLRKADSKTIPPFNFVNLWERNDNSWYTFFRSCCFMYKISSNHLHRDGHVMGKRNKATSIGNGRRKRSSLKGKKPYRGQGRRWWVVNAVHSVEEPWLTAPKNNLMTRM